jgi:hypothetical protein
LRLSCLLIYDRKEIILPRQQKVPPGLNGRR